MKKLIICLCLIGFINQSCNKMLDEEVVSGVSDVYYTTRAGFEAAVNATYAPLRSFYATERGMTATVFGTDTYTMGQDGSWKFINEYKAQMDGRTGIFREIWNDFYIGINTANAVIDRADEVANLDPAVKTKRVAEARFLRAHYYFILVQMFGPVHLSLTENTQVTTEATRTPISEIYDAIVSDLEIAAADLPEDPEAWGRATKYAAQHMLARVHLTRASSTAAKPDDYQKAAEYADAVINSGKFKLLPDFAKVFEQGAGEINEEVIWSVQYTSDPLTNGGGNNAHVFFLMEYDIQPGMQRDVANGRPFKRFRPTDFTLNTLFQDRLNDTRYEKSFKHVFYTNKPGTYSIDGNQVTLAAGDTALWLPGYNAGDTHILTYEPKLTAAELAQKATKYQVATPDKYKPNVYPALTKFLDPLRPDRTEFRGSRDFLAFRLAETYLIAAEAYMMLGDLQTAADRINMVRLRSARVGKTPAETEAYRAAMTVTPDQLNIDFILNERGRELLGEQFRWFDLVRTGKLLERVTAHNPEAAANIQPFHVLRPIPQDQIDRTTTDFPQNEGFN